jgi:hypothetical protein
MTGRIAQAIEGIARAAVPGIASYVRRKKLVFLDGDMLPLLIVAVADAEEFEPIAVGPTKGVLTWGIRRPCQIAFGFASGGRTGNNDALRIARDAIWGAVTAIALQRAGVAEANLVLPTGRGIFGAESTPGVDWSVLAPITVETLEERNV